MKSRPLGDARTRLVLCCAIGATTIVAAPIVLAYLTHPRGIWVVWTVLQVPIGAVIGLCAWLSWRASVRRLAARGNPHATAVAAIVGAGTQGVLLTLYWFDTPVGVVTMLHAALVPLATLATLVTLSRQRKSAQTSARLGS